MDARQAIMKAKEYVADIFGDEGVFNIGLEEISFDDECREWNVTIGFSRRWDTPSVSFVLGERPVARTYKVVVIDDVSDVVMEVRNRPVDLASKPK